MLTHGALQVPQVVYLPPSSHYIFLFVCVGFVVDTESVFECSLFARRGRGGFKTCEKLRWPKRVTLEREKAVITEHGQYSPRAHLGISRPKASEPQADVCTPSSPSPPPPSSSRSLLPPRRRRQRSASFVSSSRANVNAQATIRPVRLRFPPLVSFSGHDDPTDALLPSISSRLYSPSLPFFNLFSLPQPELELQPSSRDSACLFHGHHRPSPANTRKSSRPR